MAMYLLDHLTLSAVNGTREKQPNSDMFTLQYAFETYVPTIVIVLGVIGNSLLTMVMIKPKFRKQPALQCLMLIAIFDNLTLVSYYFYFYLDKVSTASFLSNVYCRIFGFVALVTCAWSTCLLVIMASVRFVAIHWPLRSRGVCTLSRVRTLIIVILVLVLLLHLPFVEFLQLASRDHHTCIVTPSNGGRAVLLLHTVIFIILPFPVILALNVALSVDIRRKPEATIAPQTASSRSHLSADRGNYQRISGMLIATCWIYIVLVIPWYVQELYYIYIAPTESNDPTRMAVNSVCSTISITNFAVNFYVYCAGFQGFRRELVSSLCGWTSRPDPSNSVCTITGNV